MAMTMAATIDLLGMDAAARQSVMPAREQMIMVVDGSEVRLLDRRDGRLLARADVGD